MSPFPPEETLAIISFAQFEENYGDMADKIPYFIDDFMKVCPQRMQTIQTALAAGDAESVRKVAHMLKGTLAQFFAVASLDLALGLEQAGIAGDLPRAARIMPQLQLEIDRLFAVLLERKAAALATLSRTA